ncbi:ubiquitin-conjugating enzyme E2 U-like [Lineus longissimus]|uniref:ubiquitin-conjugating enzyme E2 U-like n=1 Tax=Lineus longissimus TaxID=88925 RepID=UPI002B4EDC67
MYSRAHLLIEKEYEDFLEDKPWGIEAHPLRDDSLFEWTAKIQGLKRTLWEGGVFRIYIKFDENYKLRPPQVCFHTIPFHPNIDMITGKPCIEFLDDFNKWTDSYQIGYILLAVQNLLSNPVLNNAVNTDAVDMIMNNPHAYKQMVLDCVSASQRIEAGLHPHVDTTARVRFQPVEQRQTPRSSKTSHVPPKVYKLSFEDYHLTWSGMATSVPKADMKNPLIEAIHDDPMLQKTHMTLPMDDLQLQMSKQLEDHNTLMYGKFNMKSSRNDEDDKLAKINQMRKIYLPKRGATSVSESSTQPIVSNAQNTEEHQNVLNLQREKTDLPFDKEVDELVAWTAKLDEDTL